MCLSLSASGPARIVEKTRHPWAAGSAAKTSVHALGPGLEPEPPVEARCIASDLGVEKGTAVALLKRIGDRSQNQRGRNPSALVLRMDRDVLYPPPAIVREEGAGPGR